MHYRIRVPLMLTAFFAAVIATVVSFSGAQAATLQQQAGVVVTKTVGTVPVGCADESSISADPGSNVFYCLTVKNTGNVNLLSITIDDPSLNIVNRTITFPAPLPPNTQLPPIVRNGPTGVPEFGPVTMNQTTVNTLSYSVAAADNSTLNGTASATVTVGQPSASAVVTKTVRNIRGCADTTQVTVAAGVEVFYCLTVENTGNVPFESITITDTNLGIANRTIDFPAAVPPGTTIPLPSSVITEFGPVVLNQTTVNTISYRLTPTQGSPVRGTASATVNVVAPNPSAAVTKTVGATPGCSESSSIDIATGLNVFYCLTILNTGNVPFDSIVITDANLGLTNLVYTFPNQLPPLATFPIASNGPTGIPEFGPVNITGDTVNTITYKLRGVQGSTTGGTTSASVTTGPAAPSAVVTKTVGTTPQCADGSTLSVVSGTDVFYCLRVRNTGNVPFESITITDTNVGVANRTITFPAAVPPGTAIPLPSAVISEFGSVNITGETVNTVSYLLTGTEGSTVSGTTAPATVTLETANPAAVVTKTVGITPGCADGSEVTVAAGTAVFYCLRVRNTGNVGFESISITDPNLNLTNEVVTFPLPVAPGITVPIPSAVVSAFGPVTVTQNTVNNLSYVLTPVSGSTVSGTASATVNVETVNAGATVTKTVGTTPGCATTSSLTVAGPTDVFYCLRVRNTGNVPFASITITDTNVGLANETIDFPVALQPGDSIPLPSAVITAFGSVSVTERTVNNLSYLLTGTQGSTVSGTASATVNVGTEPVAEIGLSKTVGTVADTCATTSSITVSGSTTVFYCFTVSNTGTITLPMHDLQDDKLGTLLTDFEFDLAPGASTSAIISATVSTTTTNTATWTASTADGGLTATATDTATVTVEGGPPPEEEINLPIIRKQ